MKNWLRSKSTIEFLGFWEKLNNPDFKLVEFDQFWNNAGANAFVLSPQKWIEYTNAIGSFPNPDAGAAPMPIKILPLNSPLGSLYIIKEFQRLKAAESERQQLGWDVKRLLTKVNYKLHTDAIKAHLIPQVIQQIRVSAHLCE